MTRVHVRALTDAERAVLWRWVRNKTVPTAVRRRARVVLLSSYDLSTYTIALLIPMARQNVIHWVRRFDAEGPKGLYDRPRPGRPGRRTQPSS
jgi:transposase